MVSVVGLLFNSSQGGPTEYLNFFVSLLNEKYAYAKDIKLTHYALRNFGLNLLLKLALFLYDQCCQLLAKKFRPYQQQKIGRW
jgi:hypothetical protein